MGEAVRVQRYPHARDDTAEADPGPRPDQAPGAVLFGRRERVDDFSEQPRFKKVHAGQCEIGQGQRDRQPFFRREQGDDAEIDA